MNVPTYLRYLQWQIFVFNLDFFYGCPISVTSQNYVQNIKFEIRWKKKKGMGKESLTVSMETNPCIVDPINCSQ